MTVAMIRAMVPDRAQYDRASATGDGGTVEFLLANRPVLSGSAKVYVNGMLKANPADYSIDEDLGLVTFTAAPANATSVNVTYRHTLISDTDLTTFLTAEGSVVKRATALALESIASDQVLVLKVMKLMDLQVDGSNVSDALLKRAAMLRDQASQEEAAEDGGSFDVADMIYPGDSFGYRERVWNEGLRDA